MSVCWFSPDSPPKSVGEVWVRYECRETKAVHAAVGYWDGHDYCFVQCANDHSRDDDYTFDYIGTVTGWQPLIAPETS